MHFTKTVYSICYPEVQAVIDSVRPEAEMYTETWSKKQDENHKTFLATWKNWVNARLPKLDFEYPTNGSSEAIREQIVLLASRGKSLVVFEGEYEGYIAIAASIGMPYREIVRGSEITCSPEEVFFISEPSAIDGNSWAGFESFMQLGIPVYVDVTYLGSYDTQKLNIDYPNVEGVFFSLSKIFGVYYHRIGGVLLKENNPLLYGNIWFKNLYSLKIGEELMKRIDLAALQKKLKSKQETVLKDYPYLMASDVPLLATTPQDVRQYAWQGEYVRKSNSKTLRICISPLLEGLIREKH